MKSTRRHTAIIVCIMQIIQGCEVLIVRCNDVIISSMVIMMIGIRQNAIEIQIELFPTTNASELKTARKNASVKSQTHATIHKIKSYTSFKFFFGEYSGERIEKRNSSAFEQRTLADQLDVC
ncbi:MAG: hypothetical protein EZS28_021648 [Streblomastix strix]|uniref:Uncharacterized protein n=1 Tax=Streblomastix strix TaxID=222440 RepID=A0A5J4VK42_9EUKA|nr:MAG: hypothetical protein EZS28_021648 [Streblomastix strix]